MTDYKSYLAANILSEDKVVTYRLLSRALKVHVNAAKEMLYEFHRQQNGKKPGTIHATYLLSGTKRVELLEVATTLKKDGEDEYMHSSPFMNSSIPQSDEGTGAISTLTITLTREEDLDQIRCQYEQLTSIHIYSLGPHPLKASFFFSANKARLTEQDLQLLADSSRELRLLSLSEDPLISLPTYGAITNPAARRRTNRRPPPAPASLPTITTKAPVGRKERSKVEAGPGAAQSSKSRDFFEKGKEKIASGSGSKENISNPPALKRESSSLLKSFAKAKPKITREDTATDSEEASVLEDEPINNMSEDEEESYVPPAPSSEIAASDRKSRKEREAALKRMMEDEEGNLVAASEPEVDDVEPLEAERSVKEEEPVIEVSGGRRRGRRKIIKKKTVKDDEGYLVTREEAVWESFSEDEPAPPKMKAQPASNPKAKKLPAKVGQGNIMSFFGKR